MTERERDPYDNHHRRDDQDSNVTNVTLTTRELDQLRKMLSSWDRLEKMIVAHERAEWFWSSLSVWLKWIAAIAAALVAAKLLLSDFKEVLKGWLSVR